jgi:hypothetical protein
MEDLAFFTLVASMIANFIVLGISLNRPNSFFPVSLSAISISLQEIRFATDRPQLNQLRNGLPASKNDGLDE